MSTNDHQHRDNGSDGLLQSNVSEAPSNSVEQDSFDSIGAKRTHKQTPAEYLGTLPAISASVPSSMLRELPIFCGSDGSTYIGILDGHNAHAVRVDSKQANYLLRRLALQSGIRLKSSDFRDLNADLIAHAETSGDVRDVWYRVAPYKNGIEIDIGDDRHSRIRVTPNNVDVVKQGSETLFHRSSGMRPFVMPADNGDYALLRQYLNLDAASAQLLIAWISYTLAHPKMSTTKYVILVLQGDQGSGKSTLCQIIQSLVDPNVVGVQTFPRNPRDLAIFTHHSHTLFFDNLREIKPSMADALSIAATGGTSGGRKLYSDADQSPLRLHAALVLNGIHTFIDQPDLAQRCLTLNLRPFDDKNRLSENDFIQRFQADSPIILRGLLDLIARVLAHVHSVEATNPERMIDFVKWLAAMEIADDVPSGVYQMQYSEALNETMLDSLQEHSLAAAVISFITGIRAFQWSGTPTDLLNELNLVIGKRAHYSRDWPQNAIALSRQLRPLQAVLKRQGIEIRTSRGRERRITIFRMDEFFDE